MCPTIIVVGALVGGWFLVGCCFHGLDLMVKVMDHLEKLHLGVRQGGKGCFFFDVGCNKFGKVIGGGIESAICCHMLQEPQDTALVDSGGGSCLAQPFMVVNAILGDLTEVGVEVGPCLVGGGVGPSIFHNLQRTCRFCKQGYMHC